MCVSPSLAWTCSGFARALDSNALVCPAAEASGELLEALQVAKAQRLEVADAPAPEMEAAAGAGVALREARVIAVHEGGMADRVALDFTTCADLGPRTPD